MGKGQLTKNIRKTDTFSEEWKEGKRKLKLYSKLRKETGLLAVFSRQFIIPAITGVFTLCIQYIWNYYTYSISMSRKPFESELIFTIMWTILSLLFVIAHERAEEINMHTDVIQLYEILYPHRWLNEAHSLLPEKLKSYLSRKLEKAEENGGGIVVLKVTDDDYLEWLKECLESAENSYEAILTAPYWPKWFFTNENQMDSKQKCRFLSEVNNHPNKRIKRKRIMIFKECILESSFSSAGRYPKLLLNPDEIKFFFAFHTNVELSFINLDLLENIGTWYQKVMIAVSHDFALIDKELVLKRNGKFELSFCFGKTDEFQGIFDENMWNIYKRITLNKDEIISKYNLSSIIN